MPHEVSRQPARTIVVILTGIGAGAVAVLIMLAVATYSHSTSSTPESPGNPGSGNGSGTAPTGHPFTIDSVTMEFAYGGSGNGYFGLSDQNICGTACPVSWPPSTDICAGAIEFSLSLSLTNHDTEPHTIQSYSVDGGGSSATLGDSWTGVFEDTAADVMMPPYTLAPGQTSGYPILGLSFDGTCGHPPSGVYSISVVVGAE